MSKIKSYYMGLAARTAEAVWTENRPEDMTEIEMFSLIIDAVFTDMEELFDVLWENVTRTDSPEADMPLTFAICKELAQLIPDHIEIMYELDTDLNPLE